MDVLTLIKSFLSNIPTGVGVAFVVLLCSLIKIKPMEINVLQWLGRKIGDALTHNIMEKVNEIAREQKEMKKKIEEHEKEDKRQEALEARRRILEFAREILVGEKHTKEDYICALESVDFYEKYSEENPGFQNNRCLLAIDLLKSNYAERLAKADFLAEEYRNSLYAKRNVQL